MEKSPIESRLRHSLSNLVKEGIIFCPLSSATILELCKQNIGTRLKRAELMEELSLNACFAPKDELFQWEIEAFLMSSLSKRVYDIPNDKIFVPVTGYLNSRFSVEVDANLPEEIVSREKKIFEDEINKVSSLTLTEFVCTEKQNNLYKLLESKVPKQYSQAREFQRQISGGNKEEIIKLNENQCYEIFIKPTLDGLPEEIKPLFSEHFKILFKGGETRGINAVLKSLPSMNNLVEITSIAGLDTNRKYSAPDFFDIDMVAIPLAYAQAFVTRDGWIRDILEKSPTILKRGNCKFFSEMSSFETWLNQIG